ncbi:hypothetical protein [uncultured Nonlabens sp.]|uniref:hypothetical protein n=1 Tax=uncultured Nonlabens sp. TaxID=859306 RepID=UPI0026395F6E|nr:hypothetical protein [uncultured Nonlabens sp.]
MKNYATAVLLSLCLFMNAQNSNEYNLNEKSNNGYVKLEPLENFSTSGFETVFENYQLKNNHLKRLESSSGFRFYAIEISLGIIDVSVKDDKLIEVDPDFGNSKIQQIFGSLSIYSNYKKHLFGLSAASGWELKLFDIDPIVVNEYAILYGRAFQIAGGVNTELFTGAGFYQLKNTGNNSDRNIGVFGVPIKAKLYFLKGNRNLGISVDTNINSLTTNFNYGLSFRVKFK